MGSKEGVAWLVVVCCCSDQYVMIWLTRAALVASDCMRVPIVTTLCYMFRWSQAFNSAVATAWSFHS